MKSNLFFLAFVKPIKYFFDISKRLKVPLILVKIKLEASSIDLST